MLTYLNSRKPYTSGGRSCKQVYIWKWLCSFLNQLCCKANWLESLHGFFFRLGKVEYPPRNVGNKAVPWLETSFEYAVLYWSIPANKYMSKVNTETPELGAKRNQSCQQRIQQDFVDNTTIALLSLLLTLIILHLLLVFLLLTWNMYLFSGFDLIFQSVLDLDESKLHLFS